MYRDSRGFHTDSADDRDFGARYLEGILEYVTENFEITDLYDKQDIADAARDFISDHYYPQDLFDDDELALWAAENGYVIAKADNG